MWRIPRMVDFPHLHYLRLTASIAALLLTQVGEVRAVQFRVCTFGFHSPHEIAVFKSELSPQDFEFIDLSPPHIFSESGE